jgi:hypothetical protein
MHNPETVISHIKSALGPLPWDTVRVCKECDYRLKKTEKDYCKDCRIKH